MEFITIVCLSELTVFNLAIDMNLTDNLLYSELEKNNF